MVFRMAPVIVSDSNLSNEEKQLFSLLSYTLEDKQPDAIACRLKFSLVSKGCSEAMKMPWDVKRDTYDYMARVGLVSAACRLTVAEEQELLSEVWASMPQGMAKPPLMINRERRPFDHPSLSQFVNTLMNRTSRDPELTTDL